MFRGIGIFTSILTLLTLIGFLTLLVNKKIGVSFMLIISTLWLLRYFEHVGFLLLYDPNSYGRWMLIIYPLILGFIIFGLTLKEFLRRNDKQFRLWYWIIPFIGFLSIGLLSFIYKTHTDEFNCWYYLDKNSDEYKISFAITPDHKFEATTNSKNLEEMVIKEGLTYRGRNGFYWPESKVRVTTRFKKIIGLEILGFRNSSTDKKVRLKNPIEIDVKTIKGDKSILQPEFSLGD